MRSVQLGIKAGDRVKIVIPAENLKFEADKVYPQHGTGTIQDYVDKKGVNHGYAICFSGLRLGCFSGLVYIKLDVPFKRTGLLDDGGDSKKKRGPTFRIMEKMWVPFDFLRPENRPS